MLISKKELLKKTKISYGQLYRWKRKNIIPEQWFIKKSSYTGQETFFPEEKILKRINMIKDLKDKHSLEEIAKILSPEISERNFTEDDINVIEEIESVVVKSFKKVFLKSSFSFIEVLLMVALSDLNKEKNLSLDQITNAVLGIKEYVSKLKSTDYILLIYDQEYYIALYQEQGEYYFDKRLKVLKKFSLNNLSNRIKLKYRKVFDLRENVK